MSRDRGERNARQPKANGELKASLCLDSKNEGGKLAVDPGPNGTGLCLDSKNEGGKLRPGFFRVTVRLCLDSKNEGGKL